MRILLLLACCGLSLPLQAEIYRWVDANGQVHFGERPRPGAETVEVRPQVIERDQRMRDGEADMQRLYEVRTAEREQRNAQRAERRRQQNARCQQLQQRLADFQRRTYWYEEDAQGRQVEVSPARVREAEAAVRQQIAEQC
ncbi:MAG TPA: DUF4124 domain-containing protein [Pseudomonas sp.]|nr:DUF4124 domain-containing protein [Pseudomonas sp.]MBB50886.1 DUF4124 domain-containing protein [Pseudomonadales bacterium]HCA22960.1 DUF4124 domain-containing protein [Pseudomonas sp.]|tara:strand:- start:7372 stop:7794 length:423 start_codon:yes stop_codon:yes gene_type:complete